MRICVSFVETFLVSGLILWVSSFATPPDNEDNKKKIDFLSKLDVAPLKKMKVEEDYKNSNHSGPRPIFYLDLNEYNLLSKEMDSVIEKFDFYSKIIKTDDRKEFIKRQYIFLKQIDENMYNMKKKNRRISSLPIYYYKENVKENKINDYRSKMIKVLMFIKINMNSLAMEFFKGMNEVMEEIKVFNMIDETERKEAKLKELDKEMSEAVENININKINEKSKNKNLKRRKEITKTKIELKEDKKRSKKEEIVNIIKDKNKDNNLDKTKQMEMEKEVIEID